MDQTFIVVLCLFWFSDVIFLLLAFWSSFRLAYKFFNISIDAWFECYIMHYCPVSWLYYGCSFVCWFVHLVVFLLKTLVVRLIFLCNNFQVSDIRLVNDPNYGITYFFSLEFKRTRFWEFLTTPLFCNQIKLISERRQEI